MATAGAYAEAADTMTQAAGGLWVPKHSAAEVEKHTSRTRGANYSLLRRGASFLRPRNRRSKEGLGSYLFEMIFESVFFSIFNFAGNAVVGWLEKVFHRSKKGEKDSDDAGKEAEEVADTARDIDEDTAKEILRVTTETNDAVKKLASTLSGANRDDDPEAYDACVRAGGQLVDATGDCVIDLCRARDESLGKCYDTYIESNKNRAGADGVSGACEAPQVICHTETTPAACPPATTPPTVVSDGCSTAPTAPTATTVTTVPTAPTVTSAPAVTPASAPTPVPTATVPPAVDKQETVTTRPVAVEEPRREEKLEKQSVREGTGTTVNVTVNCGCEGEMDSPDAETHEKHGADTSPEPAADTHTHTEADSSEPKDTTPDSGKDTGTGFGAQGILAGLVGLGAGILLAQFLHDNLGDLLNNLTPDAAETPPAPEAAPAPEPVKPAPVAAPEPAPAPEPVKPAAAPSVTSAPPVTSAPAPAPAPSVTSAPAPAGPAVATGAPTTSGVASSAPAPTRLAGGARKAGAW